MDSVEHFAANLIRCRENAGLSRGELATRAALHKTEIEKLERGEIPNPRLVTILKLAGALGVRIGDLLADTNGEPEADEPAEDE
jgi:transcriptional regulator with XRE-family HTH domain